MLVIGLESTVHHYAIIFYYSHREFRLKIGWGIIGLWKKYILDYFDYQNQGKKIFWIPVLSFLRAKPTGTDESHQIGQIGGAI